MTQSILKGQGIKSVENAIIILEAVKNSEVPLTLTELSNRSNLSKNNLKKYLVTFVNNGVLNFDEETKTYDFGAKLVEFGLNALNRLDIHSKIEPYMLQIRDEFNESSVLAIWTEKGPMISKYQSSGNSINVEIEVGYYPSLLGGSVGKCFAAFLPNERTIDLQREEIQRYNLDPDDVIQELKQIKEAGFASRDDYFGDLPGGTSISCPIFDHTGEMIAAIGIIGFAHNLNTDPTSSIGKRLKQIADKVSTRLAYQM
mgnify:CR=1 FL=1